VAFCIEHNCLTLPSSHSIHVPGRSVTKPRSTNPTRSSSPSEQDAELGHLSQTTRSVDVRSS
jgi:hypothetical protein